MSASGKACEVILYPQDGWTVDKIISVISGRESIKTYAIILHDKDTDEDGVPKKPHYHAYLSFGTTKVRFDNIATWFQTSETCVERIKSRGRNSRYDYIVYQLHKKQPEKYQYEISDITANFDVEGYLNTHEQTANLDMIIEQCADGTINRLNFTDYIDVLTYAKYKQKIDRAWEYYESAKMKQSYGDRNISVIWIAGTSSTGKSTLAKLYARQREQPIYITAQGTHPFDGYKNQHIVCIDEIRPNMPFPFKTLIEIIDNHTFRELDARYHNVIPCFDIILITSVLTPEQFYYGCGQPEEESLQFYRRITEFWYVTRDAISICKYNYDAAKFEERETVINPVPAYLESVEPAKPLNSAGMLRKISKQYTNEQLTLFTELTDDDNTDNPFIQGDDDHDEEL